MTSAQAKHGIIEMNRAAWAMDAVAADVRLPSGFRYEAAVYAESFRELSEDFGVLADRLLALGR